MDKPVVLIVNPHPDDGEAFAIQLCLQASQLGWDVHQVLATCDEYGTPIEEYKGKRIQRIRRHEMEKAQDAYGLNDEGNPKVKLHWMNYIDGHVPFTLASTTRLQRFIRKINPDIIIGPDPFLYCDAHVDHISVGKMFFFALKRLKLENRPQFMFFYQTTMPNFFLKSINKKRVFQIRSAHRSQWSQRMLGIIHYFPFLYQLPYQLKYGQGRVIEGYRAISFSEKDQQPQGYAKLMYLLFHNRPLGCEPGRLLPPPHDLNLKLIPVGEIE